jgi:hypothetical protein
MTTKAKRKAPRLFSAEVDLAQAAALVRATGYPIPAEGDPVAARGWWDGQRRLRRLKASWANGWKVTLGVRIDGSCSVSFGLKLVTTVAKADAA